MKLHVPHHVRTLHATAHVRDLPPTPVQVFVRSYRTGLFYPQKPVIRHADGDGGSCEIMLGDAAHAFGFYGVIAVAPQYAPEWEPVHDLPPGERSKMAHVVRIGR